MDIILIVLLSSFFLSSLWMWRERRGLIRLQQEKLLLLEGLLSEERRAATKYRNAMNHVIKRWKRGDKCPDDIR